MMVVFGRVSRGRQTLGGIVKGSALGALGRAPSGKERTGDREPGTRSSIP